MNHTNRKSSNWIYYTLLILFAILTVIYIIQNKSKQNTEDYSYDYSNSNQDYQPENQKNSRPENAEPASSDYKNPTNEENIDFIQTEFESTYPGGNSAWVNYLLNNLSYPEEAIEKGIQGKVQVQFIVDENGDVSNIVAISGPEELHEEAIRVIKESGKWQPAIQASKNVKSYKIQPIIFRLE